MIKTKYYVYVAMLLQVFDGILTYVALTNNIGYEGNFILSSISPIAIILIKILYAMVIFWFYLYIKDKAEYKNYFNICIKINIFMYLFIVLNNIMVVT